jgi:hypothetical protein
MPEGKTNLTIAAPGSRRRGKTPTRGQPWRGDIPLLSVLPADHPDGRVSRFSRRVLAA